MDLIPQGDAQFTPADLFSDSAFVLPFSHEANELFFIILEGVLTGCFLAWLLEVEWVNKNIWAKEKWK